MIIKRNLDAGNCLGLPAGLYYLEITAASNLSTTEEYRKLYFAMRDIVWQEGNSGYCKAMLHEVIKSFIFPKLTEASFFKRTPPVLSTTNLSLLGWKKFIEEFKQFVQDEFNIFL